MLALILNAARIRQASVEHRIPKKKKYSSAISLMVKTRVRIKTVIIQFINRGIKRSFVLFK